MEEEIENTIRNEFLVTKLERLYKTIGRLESHGQFLKRCLIKNHIPRRLQILLEPCLAIKDKKFLQKWHSRLESFSKTIMADMIEYCDKSIEKIIEEIYGTERELRPLVGKKRYSEIITTIDSDNTKRKESQSELKMAAYYSSITKLNQSGNKRARKLKRSKCVKIKGLKKPAISQRNKTNMRERKLTILTKIAKKIEEEAKQLSEINYRLEKSSSPQSPLAAAKKNVNKNKDRFNPLYGGMTSQTLNELGDGVKDVQTFVDNVMTGMMGFRKRLKSHPKKSLAYTKLNYYGTF